MSRWWQDGADMWIAAMGCGSVGSPLTMWWGRKRGQAGKAISSMGLIVPLQGMLGGRYGLALGCIIPLVSYYFIQLRPKRVNLPPQRPPKQDVKPPKKDEALDVQAPVSERALAVISIQETPYYLGGKEVSENGYDSVVNPNGCIELGTADNKVLLQLFTCHHSLTCQASLRYVHSKESKWGSAQSFRLLDLLNLCGQLRENSKES